MFPSRKTNQILKPHVMENDDFFGRMSWTFPYYQSKFYFILALVNRFHWSIGWITKS